MGPSITASGALPAASANNYLLNYIADMWTSKLRPLANYAMIASGKVVLQHIMHQVVPYFIRRGTTRSSC
jgi:hypothetical protein